MTDPVTLRRAMTALALYDDVPLTALHMMVTEVSQAAYNRAACHCGDTSTPGFVHRAHNCWPI